MAKFRGIKVGWRKAIRVSGKVAQLAFMWPEVSYEAMELAKDAPRVRDFLKVCEDIWRTVTR